MKLIKAGEDFIREFPIEGRTATLEEMQKAVGGFIEIVPITNDLMVKGLIMIVNEEGLIKNLPANHIASILIGGIIVGDVLIARSEEVE